MRHLDLFCFFNHSSKSWQSGEKKIILHASRTNDLSKKVLLGARLERLGKTKNWLNLTLHNVSLHWELLNIAWCKDWALSIQRQVMHTAPTARPFGFHFKPKFLRRKHRQGGWVLKRSLFMLKSHNETWKYWQAKNWPQSIQHPPVPSQKAHIFKHQTTPCTGWTLSLYPVVYPLTHSKPSPTANTPTAHPWPPTHTQQPAKHELGIPALQTWCAAPLEVFLSFWPFQ